MAIRVITVNRKAFYDYHILETVEVGLALAGSEVKSIRAGRVNLRDAYAQENKGELWLLNAHIARYQPGGPYGHDPQRPRKLLLHKEEINELLGKMARRGFTLVPLKLYLKDELVKVELALAQGKRQYDRRQAIASREAEREISRATKKGITRYKATLVQKDMRQ